MKVLQWLLVALCAFPAACECGNGKREANEGCDDDNTDVFKFKCQNAYCLLFMYIDVCTFIMGTPRHRRSIRSV